MSMNNEGYTVNEMNGNAAETYYAPAKVKANGTYMIVPKQGYGSDVFAVLLSVCLILGGMSGQFVLRGTQSSTALVVAGFIFLGIDIFGIVNKSKKRAEFNARISKMHREEDEVLRNSRQLETDIPVKVAYDKGQSILMFNPAVNGVTLKKNTKGYVYEGTLNRQRNILNFEALDLTVVFDVKDANEIVFTLVNDKKDYSVVLPSNVEFVTNSVNVREF